MKWFNIIITAILLYFGYKYIDTYFFLYVIFICLTAIINWHFCNVEDIKKNILYVFTFTGWLIYTGLGFIRQGYMSQLGLNNNNMFQIYILYIMSTLLLLLPMKLMHRKKISGFGNIVNQPMPNFKIILILICIAISLNLYRVYLAGGWVNFIYAAYGQKTDTAFLTFFNLFIGLMDNMIYVVLPIICLHSKIKIKVIAIFYFIFTIFMGCINGSSMSLFNPLLALLTYTYIMTNNLQKRATLKKYFLIVIIIGVIGGVLIRQNRSNNEEFTLNVVDGAIEDVLESSTFDNVTNLQKILDLEPEYGVGQFIYPYINYLPRSVFPWKPIEMGRIISYKFKQMDKDSLIAFLPSPIGEFYYDFGYLGIIIGMLFVGYIISLVQEKLNNTIRPTNLLWGYCMGVCIYLTIYSGWYTGCFTRIVRLFILILIINYLSNMFKKKSITFIQ